MSPNAKPTTLLLAACLLLLGACTHSASDRFSFQSVGEPTRSLLVETFEGDIHLIEDRNATRVHGTVHVLARGFDSVAAAKRAAGEVRLIETGAEDMVLTVDTPPRSGSQRFVVTLELFVPPNVVTTAFSDAGGLSFQGVAVADAQTVSGPIELVGTRGNVKLRTEQAPIFIEAHQGSVDARTVNAPISAMSVFGELTARTTNGPIDARVTPPVGGEVVLSTLNAPVDLVLPRTFGAVLVVSTSPEAAVVIDMPGVTPEFLAPGQFEGYIWDGSGYVDVRTTNADVVVRER